MGTDAIGRGFDRAKGYDDLLRRNEEGARRLVECMPPGPFPEILDVGCGTGFASLSMAEMRGARRIVGVDVSAGMLERFRNKMAGRPDLEVTLHQADVLHMPVPGAAFDAVVSSMAFHWFPDKPAALAAMGAALRPDGALGILASGRGTDREFQAVLAGMLPEVPEDWVTVFDHIHAGPDQMEDWLEAAGLEPLDVWMEVRRRRQHPDEYLERIAAVASHLSEGMDPERAREVGARLREALLSVSGPRGFEYTFAKLYAIARRPGG